LQKTFPLEILRATKLVALHSTTNLRAMLLCSLLVQACRTKHKAFETASWQEVLPQDLTQNNRRQVVRAVRGVVC
jgi:hypothetical protein